MMVTERRRGLLLNGASQLPPLPYKCNEIKMPSFPLSRSPSVPLLLSGS